MPQNFSFGAGDFRSNTEIKLADERERLASTTAREELLSSQSRIPSPLATGGAGERFEQRLDGYALALLLARATPPVLLDTTVVEVMLQTRHLGWQTDDLLIIGETSTGTVRQLAVQAKRTFNISASDKECRKTIRGMWDDFTAPDRFNEDRDRLAVATLHGTSTLLSSFSSLLDCARTATDHADYQRRLEGYLSQKAQYQNEALLTILREHVGTGELDPQEYWKFLRVLNVLSFDLGTDTSSSEVMVLSLLQHLASDSRDPKEVASATWLRLLEVASEGKQSAKRFRREDLPADLLETHEAVPGREEKALLDLVAHGRTVRNSIRSTIGEAYALDRSAYSSSLLSQLDQHRAVVVSGPAGSGKSALAKVLLERIEDERPILAFDAVEFATAHINGTLSRTQTTLNVEALLALLAGQDRIVVFVDGLERLLEHSVRDAFAHLLRLASELSAVRLLLTCRDYSLETVRSALLAPAGLGHSVFEVPPVSDAELDMLKEHVQGLAPPLGDPVMRSFLRTPYLLDMASKIEWATATLPRDMRTFQELCWRQLVRDEAHPAGGMPRRREAAFTDVARLRAAQLRPFIRPDTDDIEALTGLEEDGLLERSSESTGLFAPAHDVLEDWAIIYWLSEVQAGADDRAQALADAVGGLPAVRRGLRRWLADQFEEDSQGTTGFILEVSARSELPQYFRDDCIVGALLSEEAEEFVQGCRGRVSAGDSSLLKQVVHLLRVACKAAPQWLPTSGLPSNLLIPTGTAWAPTLEMVAENLPSTPDETVLLALGLVEDWAKQVTIATPAPEGSDAAGRIVSHIIPLLDGHTHDETRKRALQVLLKIPAHAPIFSELAERALMNDWQDRCAREFSDLVTSTLDSAYAARDFPDTVLDILRSRLMLSEADLSGSHYSSIDVSEYFGIREGGASDYFPASALQGPFWALLKHHPRKAVNYIVEVMNHGADWYGNRRGRGHDLEPAIKITVGLPDEGQVEHWLNGRLFTLYRGMTVGPESLKSALMALESWLLEATEFEEFDLESWLLHLLRKSNNAMVTGVVASLCVAHPERAGQAAIALLSCRELIEMDRQRVAREHAHSTEFMTGLNPSHRIYEEERRKANRLPHRGHDLEYLAVQLQFTDQRETVWALIDQHRANLPDQPKEDHLIWQLALHRMDVRGYGPVQAPESTDREDGQNGIYLGPTRLEPEVQALVDNSSQRWSEMSRHLRVANAANAAWRREEDAPDWRSLLSDARSLAEEGDPPEAYLGGGPGIVAAFCIRDHLPDLSRDEEEWCALMVEKEIVAADEMDEMSRHSRMFGPDRAAAAVVPLLVAKAPEALTVDPKDLLLQVLTHPVDEVTDYAFSGAGTFLGPDEENLILRFSAAAVVDAEVREELRRERNERIRRGAEPVAGGVERRREAVRPVLSANTSEAADKIKALDFDSWEGRRTAGRICKLLGARPEWSGARAFFEAATTWLAQVWKNDRHTRFRSDRDHHAELNLRREIAGFGLKLPEQEAILLVQPLIELVAEEPREVAEFVHDLIAGADGGGEDSFWPLWQAFADATLVAPWVERLVRERPYETPLIQRLFLLTYWKEGIQHWDRLDGEAHRVHSLAERLPPAAVCVEAYARFLYTIGQQSLPDAFKVVDSVLAGADGARVVSDSDTSFYLESLLGKFVYGQPHRLKVDHGLRSAVLRLLDILVSAGSSAAYRMRDDFVTPIRDRTE